VPIPSPERSMVIHSAGASAAAGNLITNELAT
jgi:hypothetical protein